MKKIDDIQVGVGLVFTEDAFEVGFPPKEAARLRAEAEALRAARLEQAVDAQTWQAGKD